MDPIISISADKPHLVIVPFPAQGHVTPCLRLAKLLYAYGFHITFVNSEFNHNRLLNSRGPSALDGLPDFRFETIPDGLPPWDKNATQHVPTLCDSTTRNCLAPFREILRKLGSPSSGVPPVTCVIADGVMSFAIDAAKELGIPDVLFWTTSACGFMAYLHYHELVARGLVPLKDESYLTNGFLDATIDWIPGLRNMRLKDIPSFIRTTDPNDLMLKFFLRESGRASMASTIILNTFDHLEQFVLEALPNKLPSPIYTIGPLSLLSHRHIPPNSPIASLGSSLWKEDTSCLDWLEGKEPSSVVLVNFGSITTMTDNQLLEFAWGLADSKTSFLWVVRPDVVMGESANFPEDFLSEIEGRGVLANWCNQEAVLMHSAIGGFLTHCGWNSTLESVSGGVPMLCWPFFAEQQTNCRYLCTEWGMGMEIGNDVRREEVEGLIRELMGGGGEMKKKALEWREMAMEVTGVGGYSFVNLDRLVKEVLLPINKRSSSP